MPTIIDGTRGPRGEYVFTRDDGSSFTTADTPSSATFLAGLPRRPEQSAPLAMGGGEGASMGRSAPPPVMSDAAPDLTGGSGGASGGATKNLVMVPQGATGGPIASEAHPAQTVSYTERSAAGPPVTGKVDPSALVGTEGGGGAPPPRGAPNYGAAAADMHAEAAVAPGGPAHLVKGGTFQTGMTQKETIEGGKPAESIRAMNDQQLTADLAGISANDAQRQYQGEVSRNMEPYKAADAEKDDYLASWKREELQKLTDDRAAAEKAAGEARVDPQQFWGDKSTGDKIAFVLASALTGFFNGRAGIQGNQVLSAVNKRIDENINAQIRNIETLKGRPTEIGRIYAQTLDKFGNMEIARNAAKARGLLEAETLARQQATQSGNEVVRAQAEKVIADLAAEREKVHFNNVGKVTQEVDRKFTTTQDKVVGGGPSKAQRAAEMDKAAAAQVVGQKIDAGPDGKKATPQTVNFGGQDFQVPAASETEAAALRQKFGKIDDIKKGIAGIRKMREGVGETLMPSAAQNLAVANITGDLSIAQSMGIIKEEDVRRVSSAIQSMRSGGESLKVLEDYAQNLGSNMLRQQGAKPVAPR